jgi:hypothetical protein
MGFSSSAWWAVSTGIDYSATTSLDVKEHSDVLQNKASWLVEIRHGQGRGSEHAHSIVFALPEFALWRHFLGEDRKVLGESPSTFCSGKDPPAG